MVIVTPMISGVAIPPWLQDIKAEARAKITANRFADVCCQADAVAMRGLVIGLWPFISEFPRILIRAAARSAKHDSFTDRELANTVLHRGPQLLLGIRRDEENHRKLWLETGAALGLQYPTDYERPVLPESRAWIDAVGMESDVSRLFLRFAAIEMIAEIVSKEFLASNRFRDTLGGRGCEWFRVHAEHSQGMTHEELELQLAFSFAEGNLSKEQVEAVIQDTVDRFIAAAEASIRIIQ